MPTRDIKVLTSLSCNKYCSFCSTSSSAKNNIFLSINNLEHVLRENEYGTVFLEGGEPFLHPEIKKLFDISLNRPGKVAITTNSYPAEKVIKENPGKSFDYLIQENKEYLSFFDKSNVKFLLSVNRELIRQGDNLLFALIMASSIENSKALFNVRYYKNDEDKLVNELSNYMSNYIDSTRVNKMIRSSYLYPAGRGLNQENQMELSVEEMDNPITYFRFDTLMPDGTLLDNVYDVSKKISLLLQN